MKHTDVQVVFRFLFNRKTPTHLHLQSGLCTLVCNEGTLRTSIRRTSLALLRTLHSNWLHIFHVILYLYLMFKCGSNACDYLPNLISPFSPVVEDGILNYYYWKRPVKQLSLNNQLWAGLQTDMNRAQLKQLWQLLLMDTKEIERGRERPLAAGYLTFLSSLIETIITVRL